SEVGESGQGAVQALWASSRRKSRRDVLSSVNRWLHSLGVARSVDLPRLGPTQFLVEITNPSTGIQSTLADVGFGVSQLLPALVQVNLAGPGSILLMEQPEIHLHPSLQAGLADLLIWGAKNKRQLIVETHSE